MNGYDLGVKQQVATIQFQHEVYQDHQGNFGSLGDNVLSTVSSAGPCQFVGWNEASPPVRAPSAWVNIFNRKDIKSFF